MATFQNISDNEMNYFQFKARQFLLLKKENCEWKEYCNQVAPECSECCAEKANSQSSKSIGIQVSARKPSMRITRQPLPTKKQTTELPEALNQIKTKLENIDLALSKMYDSSSERREGNEFKKDSEKTHAGELLYTNHNSNENAPKSFEERRKLLIQNSLKASLEKMHCLIPKKPMKPVTVIKKKESGFILPHDLQVKRAAARKAYLASLKTSQTKPKTVAPHVQQIPRKDQPSNLLKKDHPKTVSKPKKKSVKKSEKSNDFEEETLVKTLVEADEYKDENIECMVDGILDDLLGETVLDLSRIRQLRAERQAALASRGRTAKDNEATGDNLSSTFLVKDNTQKTPAKDSSLHLRKLKLFLDSSEHSEGKTKDLGKKYLVSHNFPPNENSKQVVGEIEKRFNEVGSSHKPDEMKIDPKFVCNVSHVVSVNPVKAKEISLHREKYWKYLRDISHIARGNFNPWTICSVVAESILDDCIQDVAEELINVPSTIIKCLYNQEFIKQVECHPTDSV